MDTAGRGVGRTSTGVTPFFLSLARPRNLTVLPLQWAEGPFAAPIAAAIGVFPGGGLEHLPPAQFPSALSQTRSADRLLT